MPEPVRQLLRIAEVIFGVIMIVITLGVPAVLAFAPFFTAARYRGAWKETMVKGANTVRCVEKMKRGR